MRTAELLSDAERKAIALTAELTNLVLIDVIGTGPTSEQDRAEFVADIHRIQHRLMAQAAARAYPAELRLLGELIQRRPTSTDPTSTEEP